MMSRHPTSQDSPPAAVDPMLEISGLVQHMVDSTISDMSCDFNLQHDDLVPDNSNSGVEIVRNSLRLSLPIVKADERFEIERTSKRMRTSNAYQSHQPAAQPISLPRETTPDVGFIAETNVQIPIELLEKLELQQQYVNIRQVGPDRYLTLEASDRDRLLQHLSNQPLTLQWRSFGERRTAYEMLKKHRIVNADIGLLLHFAALPHAQAFGDAILRAQGRAIETMIIITGRHCFCTNEVLVGAVQEIIKSVLTTEHDPRKVRWLDTAGNLVSVYLATTSPGKETEFGQRLAGIFQTAAPCTSSDDRQYGVLSGVFIAGSIKCCRDITEEDQNRNHRMKIISQAFWAGLAAPPVPGVATVATYMQMLTDSAIDHYLVIRDFEQVVTKLEGSLKFERLQSADDQTEPADTPVYSGKWFDWLDTTIKCNGIR